MAPPRPGGAGRALHRRAWPCPTRATTSPAADRLLRALLELPLQQRMTVVLRYLEGHDPGRDARNCSGAARAPSKARARARSLPCGPFSSGRSQSYEIPGRDPAQRRSAPHRGRSARRPRHRGDRAQRPAAAAARSRHPRAGRRRRPRRGRRRQPGRRQPQRDNGQRRRPGGRPDARPAKRPSSRPARPRSRRSPMWSSTSPRSASNLNNYLVKSSAEYVQRRHSVGRDHHLDGPAHRQHHAASRAAGLAG